jgi:RNA polymerase sigma factor (sigma-70 family)
LGELRRVATAITGSREVALDAVQEAFARAIRLREGFRGEGTLEAWLWRIVVNTARDHVACPSAPLPDEESRWIDLESPNGAGRDVGEGARELRALVAALPERQRLVLFLRYYADLDYEAIAEVLEIASGTVGATLSQAREGLKRLMSKVES